MNPPESDAWDDADPTACPECGHDACEDHLPPDPPDPHAGALAAAAERERIRREARRLVDAEERPPVILPPFETLRTRLARPAVSTPWRIDGWQPRGGRVMLAAQYKAGKTTLRDNYIRSKVDGDLFLGRAAVTKITGALVLIDTEMPPLLMDAWLRDQSIRGGDRVVPLALRGCASTFNLLDSAVRAQWAARLREVQAEDLVLDCLRPVLDAIGLDEQREAGQFLVAFDALLRDANIAEALVIQHMGHGQERSRGDSRLRDWPDVEWRLVRRDEDPASTRYITAYGRDVDVPESELQFDRATRHLTIQHGSRQEAKVREALAAVVETVTASGELSGRAIKESLEDSESSRTAIEAALKWGVRNGVLDKRKGDRNAKLYSVSVPKSGSVRMPYWDTAD